MRVKISLKKSNLIVSVYFFTAKLKIIRYRNSITNVFFFQEHFDRISHLTYFYVSAYISLNKWTFS